MRVAFSGFGSFPGVGDNPTSRLIEALRGSDDPAFADCSFDVLDVAYASVGPALDQVLAQGPQAVVMTGFSRHAAGLRLESVETAACAGRADAFGFVPERGGPITRLACPHIDFAAMAGLLTDAGTPAEISEDAGQYVCNHTLYTAQTKLAGSGTPALFVHIPALAGSSLAEHSAGTIVLDDLVRAMALIAHHLAP